MGNALERPVVEKDQDEGEVPSTDLRWGVCAMQGWSKHMEDKFALAAPIVDKTNPLQGYSYFGVFDGHGGAKTSTACSKMLLGEIAKCANKSNLSSENSESAAQSSDDNQPAAESSSRPTSLLGTMIGWAWGSNNTTSAPATEEQKVEDELTVEQIKTAVAKGHLAFDEYLCENQDTLLKESPEDEESEKSGSTAITAFISDKHIIVSNCGDSRAVLVRGDEIIGTKDHKPTLPEEKARIVASGGLVLNKRVNGMLAVSRALGDFDYKLEPELEQDKQSVSPLPDVTAHDRTGDEEMLILACDGIWDVMSNQDAVSYVRHLFRLTESGSLKEISSLFLDTVLYKGSRDNLTVIIVVFDGKVPAYDESYVALDRELDARLEAKVEELLRDDETIDGMMALMGALSDLDIDGLPPGGGLHAKRPVIERKFNKIKRPPVEPPTPITDTPNPPSESDPPTSAVQPLVLSLRSSSLVERKVDLFNQAMYQDEQRHRTRCRYTMPFVLKDAMAFQTQRAIDVFKKLDNARPPVPFPNRLAGLLHTHSHHRYVGSISSTL